MLSAWPPLAPLIRGTSASRSFRRALPEDRDDRRLNELLFPAASAGGSPAARGPVDFAVIHHQLQSNKYVTLQQLWEEYRQSQPEGYRYSRFCELYRRWHRKQNVVLRQEHRAGEKMFVEYASQPFRELLRGRGIQASMSRKGDCWDNACSETLFGSRKVERLHDLHFETLRQAKDEALDWLLWHNQTRLHSTLNCVSPVRYEQNWMQETAASQS